MYNVLIVDEEEHLLWALEKNLFPDRSDINITTATNGEDGFESLRSIDVDLLVSDIKMPGKIDGFQLILRAKEVAPDARVIIMTAFGTNRIQNFADRIGITHYIEKPFNVGELRDAILEVLDEKEGFQGVLSDLELTDIIQMLCLAKRTALLHLKHRDHRGKIVFEKGDVTHSEFDGLKGDEAVFKMLALRQGDIFMQSDFENEEYSVTMGWQDLLFEGIKRADEERLDASSVAEDDDTDLGMALSGEDVENAIAGADSDAAAEIVSFFSEEELAEIERVSEAAVSDDFDDFDDQPPAQAAFSKDVLTKETAKVPKRESTDQHSRPTVMAESLSPDASSDDPMTVVAPTPEDDDDFRGPFTTENSGLLRALSGSAFAQQLEVFAKECPGLKMTGVIDHERGLAMEFVEAVPTDYDPDAFAVFFGEVILAAERTVRAVDPTDDLVEFQLALENEFVILRSLKSTPFVHVALVDRDSSLGVALVLMRRFEQSLGGE